MGLLTLRPSPAVVCLALACSPQDNAAVGGTSSASGHEATRPVHQAADPPKQEMGRIREDAPVPLASVLGQDPRAVERILGEPSEKLRNRISCARFLPDRVFFACDQELRRYPDRTGKMQVVSVDYEDGRAASVAMTGIIGEGKFSPEQALAIVGLELPGQSRVFTPETNVTVWDYWNGEARLVLEAKQYRVQVSVVDEEWPRSKVEILLNHPLSDDESKRIKTPG